MCGIVGIILNNNKIHINQNTIIKMTRELSNRGPDDEGYWVSEDQKCYLGHRRLSIIELSDKGSQPMCSKSKRFVITFNGEIYNHLSVRELLNKSFDIKWNSNSDTETLLESFDRIGVVKTLESIQGMFAFAVIDKLTKKLYLARDPFGEKPLYYGYIDNCLIFASELKPFFLYPYFKKEINYEALNYYLEYSFVPEPLSIFKNIYKLEKNTLFEFDLIENKTLIQNKYKPFTNLKKFNANSNLDYINELDSILKNSVSLSMTSDVEVGSFLSGGADSSLITALMQSISQKNIKTFSVSVKDPKYDEKRYSRAIAKYLKTDHHEIELNEKDFIEQAISVVDIYDEPFADSSQIPTSLISKFASTKVKVILSGDGADEFFGGYNRYLGIQKSQKYFRYFPHILRKLTGKCISRIPSNIINLIENSLSKFSNNKIQTNQVYEKLEKLSLMLEYCKKPEDIYILILKNFNYLDVHRLLNFQSEYYKNFDKKILSLVSENKYPDENMMILDQNIYLPNDILNKVDRASMHYSLETRMPFLNPNLIEFSRKIPHNLKIKNSETKWILKQVLKRYLPKEYVDRPKMGFSVPIDLWLQTTLNKWAKDILNVNSIKKQGILNPILVEKIFTQHSSRKKNYGTLLWRLIILQNWLKKSYDI